MLCLAYLDLQLSGRGEAAEIAWHSLAWSTFKCVRLKSNFGYTRALTSEQFREMTFTARLSPAERNQFKQSWSLFDVLLTEFRVVAAGLSSPESAENLNPPFLPEFVDTYLAYNEALSAKVRALRERDITYAIGFETHTALDMKVEAETLAARFHGLGAESRGGPYSFHGYVRSEDVEGYVPTRHAWRALFGRFDAVILSGSSPMLGPLTQLPAIAYELGTIREIPFYDDALGRLTRSGYEAAQCVLITNADYTKAERRLEFDPARRLYVPHACEDDRFDEYLKVVGRRVRQPAITTIFCPARQDWQRRDPQWSKANDRIVLAARQLTKSGIKDFRIRFVEWGVDVDATRKLIAKYRLQAYFEWVPPMPKGKLWGEYLRAHAVVDQFLIPAIAGVSFEVMGLGRRCITADNGSNAIFYGEQPPLLSASTVDEIAERLKQVIADPGDTAGIGSQGREWMRRYHSAERIRSILERSVAIMLQTQREHNERIAWELWRRVPIGRMVGILTRQRHLRWLALRVHAALRNPTLLGVWVKRAGLSIRRAMNIFFWD